MNKEQILNDIAEGLSNTEKETIYLLNTKTLQVVRTTSDLEPAVNKNQDFIRIEPALDDMLELMEDFALEQETEEIQEHLLQTIKSKDNSVAVESFKTALLDYPRSKKRWQNIETKWLKEQAADFLEDYGNMVK